MGHDLHQELHDQTEGHEMTFTELEYLLMLAVAILLWRNSKLDQAETNAIQTANRYATFLMKIGKGQGTVIHEGDSFKFEEKKCQTKN